MAGMSPTFSNQSDVSSSGDQPALSSVRDNDISYRETVEFADGLVRELIDDTNLLVSGTNYSQESALERGASEDSELFLGDNNNKSQQQILHNTTQFDQLQQTFQTAVGNSIRISGVDDEVDGEEEEADQDEDDDESSSKVNKEIIEKAEEQENKVLSEVKENEKENVKEEPVEVKRVEFVNSENKENIEEASGEQQPLEREPQIREIEKEETKEEKLVEIGSFEEAEAYQQDQREAITSIEEPKKQEPAEMEFTKNYSDDLLLGQGKDDSSSRGQAGGEPSSTAATDLADFELPPFSGSSSGSEQASAAPFTSSKQTTSQTRRESEDTGNRKNSQPTSSVGASAPDLTAVRSLIVSSYSRFSHVFHWKRPIESGVIFSIGLILSIALTFFSIISVVAYTALGLITASGLMRVYKMSMKTLNKSTDTPFDHIWNKVLDLNVSISPQRLHELVDSSHRNLNASMLYFKQVLLVEDKLATLKFGIFLYLLTYIGSCFNGMTLITMVYLGLFSVPLVYEKNKTNIDEYLRLANSRLGSVLSMVTQKVTALTSGGATSGDSKKKN